MSNENTQAATERTARIPLDEWAVILALLAATLIRFGIISRIPW
jgi:hypothetical protein